MTLKNVAGFTVDCENEVGVLRLYKMGIRVYLEQMNLEYLEIASEAKAKAQEWFNIPDERFEEIKREIEGEER